MMPSGKEVRLTTINDVFPAMYSTLSTEPLLDFVSRGYNFARFKECKLLARGLNDTYVLTTTEDERYVLRVYRANWRSLDEIAFEIDALIYLHQKGIRVSIPLRRNDQGFIHAIKTIEGIRYVVLFTFAPGKNPKYEKEEEAVLYGKAVAWVHRATDDFTTTHSRFSLDLDHLIYSPIRAIRPFLLHRAQDWEHLENLCTGLSAALSSLPLSNLERGFCHGDFHGWNASFSEDGNVTFYDFDCGGIGWRAYDVAVFRWHSMLREKEMENWDAFLRGYSEVRELKAADIEAVPLFIGARHVWIMGLHTTNAYEWGWLNDDYFDHQLKFLYKWETKYLAQKGSG